MSCWTSDGILMIGRAHPGPQSYFGDVSVVGLESVGEKVVRREFAFKSGDLFRETLVRRTQRRVSALQLFQFVNVEPRTQDVPDGSSIPIRVTLAESKPQRWTLGGGDGSDRKSVGE